MRQALALRQAYRQKGPFWLKNSKGSHRILVINRVNCRHYEVVTEDGSWFALDPDYVVSRTA